MKPTVSHILIALFINTLCLGSAQASKAKELLQLMEQSISFRGRTAMRSLRKTAKEFKNSDRVATIDNDEMAAVAQWAGSKKGLVVSVESSELADNGDVLMFKYDLPAIKDIPNLIFYFKSGSKLKRPEEFSQSTSLWESFDPKYHGKLTVVHDIAVKEIDGKPYRIIWGKAIETPQKTSQVVAYETDSTGRSFSFFQMSGKKPLHGFYEIPENIKGQIVTVDLNDDASRIIVVLTDGNRYTYDVIKSPNVDPNGYHAFTFKQVIKEPVADGMREHLARALVFPARQAAGTIEATRGVKISPNIFGSRTTR